MRYWPLLFYAFANAFALERAVFFLYFLEAGHQESEVSVLQVLLFIGIFILEIPTGILGDRFGKKFSLILGAILKAASLLGQTLFVESYLGLIVCFILYACSLSLISGSFASLLYEQMAKNGEEEKYSRMMALNELVDSISLAIAMALGSWIVGIFDWSIAYYITALLTLISCIPMLRIAEKRSNKGPTNVEELLESKFSLQLFFKSAKAVLGILLPVAFLHALMTPLFINSQLLFKELGTPLRFIGSLIGSVELLGAVFVFFLMKRPFNFNGKRLPLVLIVAAGLGASHFFDNIYLSYASMLSLNTLSIYLLVSVSTEINRRVKNDNVRASTLSFSSFVDTLFISLGYLTFGFLADQFPASSAIASLAIYPLAGAILAVSLSARFKQDRPD